MAAESRNVWLDHPGGYGIVSRGLHWVMAVLFAWQFAGVVLGVVAEDAPIAAFVGGSHKTLGLMLLLLVLARGIWGFVNAPRRPAHEGALGKAAVAGHLVLYALMIVVPSLALFRQYGSGRSFEPFGLALMPGFEGPIAWLTAPANLAHGFLGWTLLVLIAGHIAMALIHRHLWQDDAIGRMTRGRSAPLGSVSD
ncbi:cytochrome b [Marinivivus vitaminiproducens]|uniref:cytochrome b n=1 Tax=Marinivivus vitaminiproducens TaxID=3035935 RepID=UPI0027A8549F|nr:cytochrome b [Geminicoccaceae bacterium SCSIO 64248]